MSVFEHEGHQYRVLNGDFFGYKRARAIDPKKRKASFNMYPGDNCIVPLCMKPGLAASAIANGISEDIIYPRRKAAETASESKPKTRKPKKSNGPSISIF